MARGDIKKKQLDVSTVLGVEGTQKEMPHSEKCMFFPAAIVLVAAVCVVPLTALSTCK